MTLAKAGVIAMKNPPKAYWSLFEVAHARILPLIKSGIRPGLLNPVFGLPQPKDMPKGPDPSANERYWLDWFHEFSEINASMDRLDQAFAYLSHYPPRKVFRFHGLSEASWLRYHIEAYLQEVYILSARLSRFLRRVEKTANEARDRTGVSSVRRLRSAVNVSLKDVVRARGHHVHESRFHDDELASLDTLVLLTKAGKMRKLRPLRETQFATTLLKWRKQVLKNNKETQTLCAALFIETRDILTRNEPGAPGSRPVLGS